MSLLHRNTPSPAPSEVLALLRWIPNFRGDEGVILVPYTGHAGELLALGFTYITQDGQKSPHSPARMIYRGPSDWNSRALVRLGKPGKGVVETEGFEKALAALAVGGEIRPRHRRRGSPWRGSA